MSTSLHRWFCWSAIDDNGWHESVLHPLLRCSPERRQNMFVCFSVVCSLWHPKQHDGRATRSAIHHQFLLSTLPNPFIDQSLFFLDRIACLWWSKPAMSIQRELSVNWFRAVLWSLFMKKSFWDADLNNTTTRWSAVSFCCFCEDLHQSLINLWLCPADLWSHKQKTNILWPWIILCLVWQVHS